MIAWAAGFRARQFVRQSLWVVPLIGGVIGVVLADIDVWIEGRIALPPQWSYSADTANSVLSAAAAAMVGLIGFVVTIGVLVVQMATGTLSPRFMRLWYRDRLQKLVLAAFTATFTFSFALLRHVESDSVPDLGITLVGLAVSTDLILLLLYFNRFVHALRPVAVAAAMAHAGLAIAAANDGLTSSAGSNDHRDRRGQPDAQVLAPRSGAIQDLDIAALVRFAAARGQVCVIPHTIGDFVTARTVLMEVHGAASEIDLRRLSAMVSLGRERTIDQDPAFALRIMVDIAIRALSPAVNDPTTATQVLNHIDDLLLGIGSSDRVFRGTALDADGRVRLVVRTRGWVEYLDLGVTEIRQYGASSPQVCRRLRAMLEDLLAGVLPARRAAVQSHLDALNRATDAAFADPFDRAVARMSDRQGLGTTRPGETSDARR
ncbi:putative membrane protein [Kribbella steppae]|uniref:Putative membrane protein n=1 Tax=Kribbella steppae TaxID=2512223 RepID=A0A4V2RZ22_9ACTN|nr:putative membrane protein [Kribbella steppae]